MSLPSGSIPGRREVEKRWKWACQVPDVGSDSGKGCFQAAGNWKLLLHGRGRLGRPWGSAEGMAERAESSEFLSFTTASGEALSHFSWLSSVPGLRVFSVYIVNFN